MFHFYAFFTYTIVTAITPGPNNIMSMSNASRYGFRKSFPFNLGILCGFSVVMLLCALFSAMLFSILPAIKPFMLAVGAAYMLWLAWKTWRSTSAIETREGRGGFIAGMLLQLVNPKIMIYGMTAMASYILPYFSAPPVLAGFALFLALVGFLCTLCWAMFGAVFSKLFAAHTKLINGIMALLLVYCAVSLFL